jgi:hypothetical protein
MMEKKILTREEQAIDWLKNEIEKDKKELDKEKKQLIDSLKSFKKEDLLVQEKKPNLWQKIKKVLLT